MQFIQRVKGETASNKKKFLLLSITLGLVAILALSVIGFGFGINFKGSTEIELRFSKSLDSEEIKTLINKLFEDAEIMNIKHGNQFVIHVNNSSREVAEKIINALQTKYSSEKITLIRLDVIGPELYRKSYKNVSIPIVSGLISMILFFNIWIWFSLKK